MPKLQKANKPRFFGGFSLREIDFFFGIHHAERDGYGNPTNLASPGKLGALQKAFATRISRTFLRFLDSLLA